MVKQTAGRDKLGEFAPKFAEINDDVLFGENWNNCNIDLKIRSIITVVALMAAGVTLTSRWRQIPKRKCSRKQELLSGQKGYCRAGLAQA